MWTTSDFKVSRCLQVAAAVLHWRSELAVKHPSPTQTLQVRLPTYSAACVFPVGLEVLLHHEPHIDK